MDYRLYLLIQCPLGLKLSISECESLVAPQLDAHDIQAVLDCVQSEPAKSYLQKKPQWLESSNEILETSHRHGVRWSYPGQSDYPDSWLGLRPKPWIFSYRGEPCWQYVPLISVVGSRTPSPETMQWMQREFSRFLKLGQAGVVSGGARGVDQWSHRIAMDCGQPTICVLPTGILNPYPDGCEALWERVIVGGGCLISTVSLHEQLRKGFFQTRNLWIAGLSPMCFVVEANRRSGSMLTAAAASKQGRTLCTLPVFPTATQGLANLDLINDGAFMIRDHLDLLTLWNQSRPHTLQRAGRKSQEKQIH